MIEYRYTKEFTAAELARLFLSVGWESGKYPEKLQEAMAHSSVVISAWEGSRLVGLIRGLDDGATVGFIHYFLVDPDFQGRGIGAALLEKLMSQYTHLLHVKVMPSDSATLPLYEKFGFRQYPNYTAMERSNL